MSFNVGGAAKRRTFGGEANRRPSSFLSNEIIKNVPSLSRILHTILFEQNLSKGSQRLWTVYFCFIRSYIILLGLYVLLEAI